MDYKIEPEYIKYQEIVEDILDSNIRINEQTETTLREEVMKKINDMSLAELELLLDPIVVKYASNDIKLALRNTTQFCTRHELDDLAIEVGLDAALYLSEDSDDIFYDLSEEGR